MKLRIRGSSLRLRLTKPDVAALAEGRSVEEVVRFPGAELRYVLGVGGDRLTAAFDGAAITVRMPGSSWLATDEVGISGTDGPTSVLIEKDWACVQPRSDVEENPAEMFPHPRAT